jgi:hypothetical protein
MNEETEILTTQDEEQTVAEDIRETIGDALQEAEPASATTEETEAPAEPEYTAKFNGYKPEEAEVLKKLPVDVQKIIDAREEKFHSGIEGYRERAEFAKTIERTLAPEKELFQNGGMSSEQYINALVLGERQLRSNDYATRVQALHSIANSYGISLDDLMRMPFDQRAHQLQQENLTYKQQIDDQRYSQESESESRIVDYIDEFRSNNQYFDEVYPQILELLNSGLIAGDTPEDRLKTAYDKALRLNDEVYNKLQTSQTEQQNRIKADQAAKKAREASVFVKGAPTGATRKSTPQTTEEALYNAFESLGL